ncbi:MAG TPA: hypothetical protein VFJ96_03025 [Gemmatimonadaceae bacterium]|nr:hypothetical protein [Gemmatimonadaceae bacterium]
MPAASDRALQDALIQLLADASFRSALCTAESSDALGQLAPEHAALLRALSPDRVRRFARFVARGYYHERVAHFYKYSHALALWTARHPADALRSPGFDALLDRVTLGSRESARDVASLVDTYLADAPHAPPYAADLRRYESAQMVIEAGPRVWRSTTPAPSVAPDTVVAPDPDALVLDFVWDLPSVLPALRSLHATEPAAPSPPPAPHTATQLLFARSPRARVTVMRWSEQLARLVAVMDGTRELRDVAAAAGLPAHDVVEIASALADAGAIHIA